MAPPKACLPLRVLQGDFLGINWNRIGWMTPYSNFYPITICSGWGNRFFSSWVQYGFFHNRANRIIMRNLIIGIPTIFVAGLLTFMADWYDVLYFFCFFWSLEVPRWASEKHAKEMADISWHKPAVMFKHHYGGPVSIPGSENNIKEL